MTSVRRFCITRRSCGCAPRLQVMQILRDGNFLDARGQLLADPATGTWRSALRAILPETEDPFDSGSPTSLQGSSLLRSRFVLNALIQWVIEKRRWKFGPFASRPLKYEKAKTETR